MTRYRRILAGEIAAIIAGGGNPDAGTFAVDPAEAEPYIDETRQQRRARERAERKKERKRK